MDSTTVIRVVSGILFVAVLAVMVWRRKRTASAACVEIHRAAETHRDRQLHEGHRRRLRYRSRGDHSVTVERLAGQMLPQPRRGPFHHALFRRPHLGDAFPD